MAGIRHYINRIKNGALSDIFDQIKWIIRLSFKYKFSVVIYTLLGFSGTIISLVNSFVSRDMVDIITQKQPGKVLLTFTCLILSALFSFGISELSTYISRKVTLKVESELKLENYDKIMSSDWEALSQYHSGELMARWAGDCSSIASSVLSYLPSLIIAIFHLASALTIVLQNDASFAIFALLSFPVSLLVSRANMKRLRKVNMDSVATTTKMSSFTQESFSNLQTVKAFDMLPFYSRKLKELHSAYSEVSLKQQKVTILNAMILNVVSLLITYSAYGWGIYRLWGGKIESYGNLTMFLALSTQLTGTVQTVFAYFPTTISLTNSVKRLRDLSDLPKEDFSQREEVHDFFMAHKEDGVGICVKNIAYTYATGTEVFDNASFEAHPNEAIALVGPSGGGKTTMLRLLLALINGQTGKGYITYGQHVPDDSAEYKDLTPSCRQLFAYVPQGNTMFSGTIADNMRNVKEDATDEDIIDALKIACAWEFVEKLPDGIYTTLQERGGGLSEGQSQRLSIARAIVRKSPILLLDEATSALDIDTEHRLLRNIIKDDYPRTTIVTTHRPSVLNACTRVYSIENKSCRVMSKTEIDKMLQEFLNG